MAAIHVLTTPFWRRSASHERGIRHLQGRMRQYSPKSAAMIRFGLTDSRILRHISAIDQVAANQWLNREAKAGGSGLVEIGRVLSSIQYAQQPAVWASAQRIAANFRSA